MTEHHKDCGGPKGCVPGCGYIEKYFRELKVLKEVQEGGAVMSNEDRERILAFFEAAKETSFLCECRGDDLKVLEVKDVRHLLANLHEGREPGYRPPPSWSGKDCVGYLRKRGWKVNEEWRMLVRREWYIEEAALMTGMSAHDPEEQADLIEMRHSQQGWDHCRQPGEHHPTCDCRDYHQDGDPE